MRKIDVQVVEDHPAIQLAIKQSLNSQYYHVRHCASTVAEAEEQAAAFPIDVTILDLNLPNLSGETLIKRYKKNRPNVRILIYSATSKMSVIDRCLAAGAYGFVRKSSPVKELHTALDKIAINNTPHIPSELIDFRQSRVSESETLTSRELEVARLVALGQTNRNISSALKISERTVNIHRTNMMRKIDAHCASEVTLYAIEFGLITPAEVPSDPIPD